MQMSHAKCMENGSAVMEFFLLGFQIPPAWKPFLFLVFSTMFIVTVAGNVLIIATVCCNVYLQKPMYFFLVVLSMVEICYITSLFPTILGGMLLGKIGISFAGCISQFAIVGMLACNECFVLASMAYDRYVAIRHPLHYTTIMGFNLCIMLVAAALLIGCVYAIAAGSVTFTLQFTGPNELDHFYCDFAPLLSIACSDVSLAQIVMFISAHLIISVSLTMIIVSYVCIISTILRIPSATGRQKAFSTCSAHLIVVLIYFGTLFIVYGIPTNVYALNISKIFALAYTVATPLLNPFIYTFRNKDIREALKNKLDKCATFLF